MKKNLFIFILLSMLGSCKNEKDHISVEENPSITKEAEAYSATQIRGYELMQQKCYICHIETPDPSRNGQMIAPPMINVKEHYKPSYPNKEEFINAMVSFIQDPSEEKTLMPGAVKKFNLMPKLIYDEAELRLIAATIYEKDFDATQQVEMQNKVLGLQLNNGEKWQLKQISISQINAVIQKLDNFDSSKISEYNQLGKDVFDDVKLILLEDSYSGELFNELHNFFGNLEVNMHNLISAKDEKEAEKQLTVLKRKFQEFHVYFE